MEFRTLLTKELDKRCKKNSGYSLRAFARDLKIDPSNMSKILAGKITPYKKTQERLLLEIGVNPGIVKKTIENDFSNYEEKRLNDLQVEAFETISEWHHDAILELTKLSFFKGDIKWIAKTLELSEIKVEMAVKRLIKLGFLEIDEDGKWKDCMGDVTTYVDPLYTNQSLKNLQINLLEKSADSIKKVPIEKRDHSSTMMLIDENDLPEVKSIIKGFRKKLASFLTREDVEPNQLYQLQIGFYPLTNTGEDA